jgi:DNA-binding CsgD family transcriptional regulator
MAELRACDYRGVLEVLHAAGEVGGQDPFPKPTLAQLHRLIPCDVVSYGEFDPHGRIWRRDVRTGGEPRQPLTTAIGEAQRALRHQYPDLPFGARAGQVLRWSDQLSQRQMRKLDIYQEVGRPLECEYVLSLWLVDGKRPGGHLAFDRFQRDFSDRDLHVLELLRPHLVQLLRNAQTRRDPPDNLTARETEILRLVADGKTNREIAAALYISPGTVRKHLDNIYEELDVANRAQAVARYFRIDANT